MEITSRDIKLFICLSKYGMLSTRQIGAKLFDSIATTTVLRRLRLLESKGYLKRVLGLESHEILWALSGKGSVTASVPLPKRHWSKNMLEHDHSLTSLRLALEGVGVAHSWLPEHEIRSTIFKKHGFRGIKERNVPDGFMGVDVGGKMLSVAIELELTLKNQGRLRKTLRRYLEKDGLYALWYVASTKSILDSVYRQWVFCGGTRSSIKFYASVLSEVLEQPLMARLMGIKPHRLIGETWNVKEPVLGAHQVSRQNEKKPGHLNETSESNHAPNFDLAS